MAAFLRNDRIEVNNFNNEKTQKEKKMSSPEALLKSCQEENSILVLSLFFLSESSESLVDQYKTGKYIVLSEINLYPSVYPVLTLIKQSNTTKRKPTYTCGNTSIIRRQNRRKTFSLEK